MLVILHILLTSLSTPYHQRKFSHWHLRASKPVLITTVWIFVSSEDLQYPESNASCNIDQWDGQELYPLFIKACDQKHRKMPCACRFMDFLWHKVTFISFAGCNAWCSSVDLVSLFNNTVALQDYKKNNKPPQIAGHCKSCIHFSKIGSGKTDIWPSVPEIWNL